MKKQRLYCVPIIQAALCVWPLIVFGQGYSPAEAAKKMTVPEGLQAQVFASEPMIVQPVCIEFDDRGRLWVIQYLQYPNPAGLQRVKVDRYSRTVYDKIPEPPPRGPKGADRITILEDTDGDGHADKAKDFLNGLNLASGLAFGHGGVFVLQTPYLLFYPDRNGDDVPDSDPEVLLTGFGMEDAHSVANSLTWGPDGWLYGCQGSTVTANIQGIEFQQGVWRYHPVTRRFELFCEGGGNSWGLDFDQDGELFYSTNFGEHRMLHGVQGGYYWKSFGKHGALHNPYTYGYFDHVPYKNFVGGHVTAGGIIYQGDSLPEKFHGKYIAGDLLGHTVQWHNLEPWGSTFKANYGGQFLVPNDTWSAPSDVTVGPDGAVYVADWYDKRMAHPDPDADWDRSNGRIYKIQRAIAGISPEAKNDLLKLSSTKLVELLDSKNDWFVRRARRILADRRDSKVIEPLQKNIFESHDEHLALEALWALYVSGGFDEKLALKLLEHRSPQIRQWTVRFIGDEFFEQEKEPRGKKSPSHSKSSPNFSKPITRLVELADREPDARVRRQLASTAKRLPPQDGLRIVEKILRRNLDAQDAYIPLLCWWAVEHHCIAATDETLDTFVKSSAWKQPFIEEFIIRRLMQRFAAEGTKKSFAACIQMLQTIPTLAGDGRLLAALNQGLRADFRPGDATADLKKFLSELWIEDSTDTNLIGTLSYLGYQPAQTRALGLAADKHGPIELRVAMLQIIGGLPLPSGVLAVSRLMTPREPERIQLAALNALQQFPDIGIRDLLTTYPSMSERVRSKARDIFFSRKGWAHCFLAMIDSGKIPAGEVPVNQLQKAAPFHDAEIDRLIRKHWGNINGSTPEEKLADVRRFNNDLRAFGGNPKSGREVFQKTCATCHKLFDEGGQIGPDLTSANRKDRDYLLVNIVDPSSVIRKEYMNYQVEMTDGSFLTGLMVEQTADKITLLAANGERATLVRDKVKSLRESSVSLMPENLLNGLKPQELRDLFAWLQSDKP